MAVVHGMRITALNMFRKPVTVHYPTVAAAGARTGSAACSR